MNSKADPILFLKKDNHFNDSIDRSLVNEYTNKSCSEIILEMLNGAFILIMPILSIFGIELTNTLVFTYDKSEKSLDYINLSHYLVIQVYYFFFGFIFFLGTMKYFESFINYDKRDMKLKQVYYSFSRVFYFFSAFLIIMPLCFCSYFLLKVLFFYDALANSLFWDFYVNYLIYLPVVFYASINFHLNLQLLKLTSSFYYLYVGNLVLYWVSLFLSSLVISNKIQIICVSLLANSHISLILSHYEIKRNVTYLKEINLLVFEDLQLLKWESFFNFMKYSAFKGLLFNFRYFAVAILLYSSFYISNNYLLATALAFTVMFFPHLLSLGVSKYYKSYLENSVYDHSQNTKARYLRYFWWIIIGSAFLFTFLILLFKAAIFRILLNLYEGFFYPVNFQVNPNTAEIYSLYDKIVKFYSIFILFDSLGNGFQEILKAFNDHSRNFLSFYKGVSLCVVFYPIGLLTSYLLDYQIYWGFWIAIYLQMVVYAVFLIVVLYRNYKNSTFPSC